MSLPETLLTDIRQSQRAPRDWFSIDGIRRRDPDLEIAARYIQKTTGQQLIIPRQNKELYEKLEEWAARLLEHELRLYEQRIWDLCSEVLFVPAPEDDELLRNQMIQYINSSVEHLKDEISKAADYTPDKWYESWSRLNKAAARLTAEMSITIRLAGEIARLEMVDSGYAPVDRVGYAQIKIERFFSTNYSKIPHPLNDEATLILSPDLLKRAIRLIIFVVFQETNETRLSGFEKKFVSVFLRYLSCSRESSGAIVEQVAALFEPFLKKLSMIFDMRDADGHPVWVRGLDALIPGLGLSSSNMKETDGEYWKARGAEDAILRLAYQLRHKGAHEAHDHAYYEFERHAYFVFAALVVSCKILIESKPEIAKAIGHQEHVDAVRDLFVKIDELTEGPDGPRVSSTVQVPQSRLEKLLGFSKRAQAMWPNCSATLSGLLESEYLSVRSELTDADREADIEAFLEAQRPDDY